MKTQLTRWPPSENWYYFYYFIILYILYLHVLIPLNTCVTNKIVINYL